MYVILFRLKQNKIVQVTFYSYSFGFIFIFINCNSPVTSKHKAWKYNPPPHHYVALGAPLKIMKTEEKSKKKL